MKLTIKDIARLSGVGKSTVSRVLNNEPNVSETTKAQVLAVVEEYNFQPSRSARAMRGIENRVVGIIVTRLDSPSENRVLRGILNALQHDGSEHFIVESRFEPKLVAEHLRFFAQRRVDGVIVFGFSQLQQELLLPYKQKLVVVAQHYPELSSVYYDNYASIRLLMQRLYQQGHRQIAYLGVAVDDHTTGLLRYQAYLDFCSEKQLEPHFALGSLDYHNAYQQAPLVISEQTEAVVCATDSIAIGVNKYLQQQQRRDIQVCGVGNNKLLKFLFPQTLSIEFGLYRAGERALQQLLSLLAQPERIEHFCVACHFPEEITDPNQGES
ncbi:trehalose operon repressor TreR [Testudinibacter aquarius]|uniref:HTH-type transcriptional regulator TreR n=1 Tax=Testudinibacter aquarius TaxID=1524974 RepID=A0A4R3XY49_9PAST|nr:trehalose operon repressor TreR [Testudinibacter aquarius]KAE9529933.1 trehalose operon repressor [Testudinibacter aquarius]TCV83831.1 LacI family transcriptional regulator [Testudinibacter aquarius]TNG91440.1 HTH-type transcriptional regulator TreR [Testudinibacter aquarius]